MRFHFVVSAARPERHGLFVGHRCSLLSTVNHDSLFLSQMEKDIALLADWYDQVLLKSAGGAGQAGSEAREKVTINLNDVPGGEPAASTSLAPSLLVRLKADNSTAWRRFADLYGPVIYEWCRH